MTNHDSGGTALPLTIKGVTADICRDANNSTTTFCTLIAMPTLEDDQSGWHYRGTVWTLDITNSSYKEDSLLLHPYIIIQSSMIKPEERFYSDSQGYFGPPEDPRTEVECSVFDCDQLRLIKLKGTAKLFRPEEDVETSVLAQFADFLSSEVRAVTVNDEGLITEVSTDPEEDDTRFNAYLSFALTTPLHSCPTIQYLKLQEVDRLGPGVDLSTYDDESGHAQTVAFKFHVTEKPRAVHMSWAEINVLSSLPPRPNLLPLDRVVLEDVESRVIGFTTKYIFGGNLHDVKRPFRLEWLKQLTELVDYLNLDLGIMHQDIAPRNLLIDSETQKLILFDFNWVAFGKDRLCEGRDDVSGVVYTLYELITGDESFVDIPHWERSMETVHHLPEWACKGELDADVSKFRQFLNEWVAKRISVANMERYFDAPNRLTLPVRPTPPDYSVPFQSGQYLDGTVAWSTGPRCKHDAMKLGQYVFEWQRPPQSRVRKVEHHV